MNRKEELKKSIFWSFITLLSSIVAYKYAGYLGEKVVEHFDNYVKTYDD